MKVFVIGIAGGGGSRLARAQKACGERMNKSFRHYMVVRKHADVELPSRAQVTNLYRRAHECVRVFYCEPPRCDTPLPCLGDRRSL
jgi:hypothetical protein